MKEKMPGLPVGVTLFCLLSLVGMVFLVTRPASLPPLPPVTGLPEAVPARPVFAFHPAMQGLFQPEDPLCLLREEEGQFLPSGPVESLQIRQTLSFEVLPNKKLPSGDPATQRYAALFLSRIPPASSLWR